MKETVNKIVRFTTSLALVMSLVLCGLFLTKPEIVEASEETYVIEPDGTNEMQEFTSLEDESEVITTISDFEVTEEPLEEVTEEPLEQVTEEVSEESLQEPQVSVLSTMSNIEVIEEPQDFVTSIGASVSLSVKATGDGLTYQWQYKRVGQEWKSWVNYKSSTMTSKATSSWDGMKIRCIITDINGNFAITREVQSNFESKEDDIKSIVVTSEPQDVITSVGEKVTLSVEATGEGLSYQWQYKRLKGEWTSWVNYKSASMVCKATSSWDGLKIRCVITDAFGNSVTTREVQCSFNSNEDESIGITIINEPQDIITSVGEKVTLSVEATGDGLTYQWQYKRVKGEWTNWVNYKSASMTSKATTAWDGMMIRCVITDSHGNTATTREVQSSFNSSDITDITEITITSEPQDIVTTVGEKVTLTVEATGSGLTYQWQYKKVNGEWTSWSSYKSASMTSKATEAWDGMKIRCIITDLKGNMAITREVSSSFANNNTGTTVTPYVYGYSDKMGQELTCYILEPESYERTILMNFAIHGYEDEYDADGQVLVDTANALLEYYGQDGNLEGARLIIIPCANPDGLMYGYTNNGVGRCNGNGIDLNRDFDANYTANTSSTRYYTPYAFSASESRALRDLCQQYSPDIVLDFHGWLDYTIGDSELAEVFYSEMGLSHYKSFTSTNASGYFANWAHQQGALALLVEFTNSRSISMTDLENALNRLISGDYDNGSGEYALDKNYEQFANIQCYTLQQQRITTYAGFDIPFETVSYIDGATDLCTIQKIYANGWVKVEYPTSLGPKEAFCKLENFIDPSIAVTPYTRQVSSTTDVYRTSSMTATIGSVWSTDVFYVVADNGYQLQIIYPLDSGGWKMGWINK